MGLPALRHEGRGRAASSHLRVVRQQPKRSQRRDSRAQLLAAQRNFRLFATLTAILAVLGVSRVWLSVEATQASLDAARLQSEIRAERYEGDMLEVRQSALGSPSRIRAIAGAAMNMAPAKSVTYLDMTKPRAGRTMTSATSKSTSSTTGLQATLAHVLDLTAGEAQVLLVGDVGLASQR